MLDAALGELPANSSCLVAALAYRGHDRLTALERAYVDSGQVLPRKGVFLERLKGLEFSSFDPRVQAKAVRLAGRLN